MYRGLKNIDLKTNEQRGFSCGFANNQIPTKISTTNGDLNIVVPYNTSNSNYQKSCRDQLRVKTDTSNQLTCNYGNSSPNCQTLYRDLGIQISEKGFSCKYGNGTIPTKVNQSGDITYTSSPYINKFGLNIDDCQNNLLNYSNISTCNNGSDTPVCEQLNKNLGLKTFKQLGYSVIPSDIGIDSKPIYGKNTSHTFSCASYDNNTCIRANTDNYTPIGGSEKVTDLTCTKITDKPVPDNPNFCIQAFNYYGLTPSTNPLVINGRNLNETNKLVIDSTTAVDIAQNSDYLYTFKKLDPNFDNANITINSATNIINKVLESTPLKQGCCRLTQEQTKVENEMLIRAPIIPGETNVEQYIQFDFQPQSVSIPPNTCPPDVYSQIDMCNTFYPIYCENVLAEFQKQDLPSSDFLTYAPECACYAPRSSGVNLLINQQSVPPVCIIPKCNKDHPNAYIDEKTMDGACTQKICDNIMNLTNISAESIQISPVMINKCGMESNGSSTNSISTTKLSAKQIDSNNELSNKLSNELSNKVSKSSSDSSSYMWTVITIVIIVIIIIIVIIYYSFGKK